MTRRPKAVILAGGQGSRLGAVGTALPKCLLPIYDQPLLHRLLRHAARAGATEALISISSRHAVQLTSSLAAVELPLAVRCVVEHEPLGTAAALASFAPLVSDGPSLLILGDEYYQHADPFDRLGERLAELRPETMLVGVIRSSRARLECNVVVGRRGEVVRIKDKPRDHEIEGDLRWACFAAFGPQTLELAARAVAAGTLASPHIGDALEAIRAAGARTDVIECPDLELNINSIDDLLLATLVEAKAARSDGATSAIDAAIQELLVRAAS